MFKVHRSFNLSTGVKNNSIAVINCSPSKLVVVYHKTPVVQKNGNTITLRNGGWESLSTCIVINNVLEQLPEVSGHYVRRVKGSMVLETPNGQKQFISGMQIRPKKACAA